MSASACILANAHLAQNMHARVRKLISVVEWLCLTMRLHEIFTHTSEKKSLYGVPDIFRAWDWAWKCKVAPGTGFSLKELITWLEM